MHTDVEISASAIVEHARQRIPRFAQPRYLEFMAALPKTSSEKVRKIELRSAGLSPRTIDLERLFPGPSRGPAACVQHQQT
jgi:crotonobetaine/carnitine-CoA ligase